MRYLHTMVRVTNLEESLNFYCEALEPTEPWISMPNSGSW